MSGFVRYVIQNNILYENIILIKNNIQEVIYEPSPKNLEKPRK